MSSPREALGWGSPARRGAWALAAIAGAFLALCMVKAWPFTIDDAYITLRYSRNVARGVGPTFNATGPRAEGYTTALWMVLLVVPHVLGVDAVIVAKALGVASTMSAAVVVARWAWIETQGVHSGRSQASAKPSAWAAASAVACFAAVPGTAIHAVSGMETALFTWLVTSMFAAAADDVRGRGSARRTVVWALLSGLTRPEGNLVAFVVLAASASLLSPPNRRRFVWTAIAGWVAPIAVYEAWRRLYYGLAFPLPFYVKLATPGLLPGWPDVIDWLRGPPLHFAALLVPALVRPPRSLWPALAALAVMTAFFALPQHQMGYDHRYLAPFDGAVAAIAGIGVGRLVARSQPVATFAAAAGLALAVGLEVVQARGAIAGDVAYGEGLRAAHERLGRELFAIEPSGRLAISDAGAVPYMSGWWTLDLVGLNSASVALSGRPTPAAVLAERPDVLVLASAGPGRFETWDWNPWERPLFDAYVREGFVRVTVRRFAADYWLWVLARPDSLVGMALSKRNGL